MTASARHTKQQLDAAVKAHRQGKLDDAIALYESLLKKHPHHPELYYALASVTLQRRQWQRTMQYLTALLLIDPSHAAALKLLFEVCRVQATLTPLPEHPIHALIEEYPKLVPLRSVAASLCQSLGAHAERLEHLEAVKKLGVKNENFSVEWVKALRDTGQYARAMEECQNGLKTYAKSLPLLKLRAELHLTLADYDKALSDGEKIVKRSPADHYARTTLGSIKLLMSDCREGYEDYAAHGDFAIEADKLHITAAAWQGEKLKGKKLLLWSSQGIGDIIMFASFVPWLLKEGAQVTLATYKKLMPLFARSFPGVTLIEHTPSLLEKHSNLCDFQASLGQLMPYVLPHYEPSEHKPYLKADKDYAATLRKDYQGRAKGKKLIGISWSTTNAQSFSQRNIPLKEWSPMFNLPDVQCVSLQYGDHKAAIDALNKKKPGALLYDATIDAYDSPDALAAQIAAMDAVISIQNSTVHLAGALGVKTTLLLSAASDWRWGLNRTDSRWYKSVTIERQETLLDWKNALKLVAKRL